MQGACPGVAGDDSTQLQAQVCITSQLWLCLLGQQLGSQQRQVMACTRAVREKDRVLTLAITFERAALNGDAVTGCLSQAYVLPPLGFLPAAPTPA